jgi:hypothetical protein
MNNMKYVKVLNNTPTLYSIERLKRENPNISFPEVLTEELLAEFSVFVAEERKVDSFENPIELIGKRWAYNVVDSDEKKHKELSDNIRQLRYSKLVETDWVVLRAIETNTEIPEDWKTYRQALRDITEQLNFPNFVEWPISPVFIPKQSLSMGEQEISGKLLREPEENINIIEEDTSSVEDTSTEKWPTTPTEGIN